MPWWASTGTIRSILELCCYIAVAQMWNLLAGYAGLVSVGQQAFMGAAGYALFVLAQNLRHQSVPRGLPVAAGAGRAGGADLSAAAPPRRTVFLDRHLGGGRGVPADLRPTCRYVNAGAGMSLAGHEGLFARFERECRDVAALRALMLLLTVGGSYWLLRSRFGLALIAMRDNPVAAASQGVNVAKLRFLIYVAAAVGCGLAGAIYFMAQLRITPELGL